MSVWRTEAYTYPRPLRETTMFRANDTLTSFKVYLHLSRRPEAQVPNRLQSASWRSSEVS